MRRVAALLLALVGTADAQGVPERRREAVPPRALQIYGADDPLAALKVRVEELTGIYLVDPPRRHPSERVTLKGDAVRIQYWQTPTGFSDEELLARAVGWFLLGRTQYASGARGIFGEMPAVERVTLVFQDVVRPEKKGRRRGEEEIHEYLTLELTRQRFESIDLDRVRQCVERVRCGPVAKEAFDRVKFEPRARRK